MNGLPDGTLPSPDDVLEAARRLQGHVVRTPVLRNEAIDALAGAELFFKCENLQLTGSFKIRGATNRLMQIDPAKRRRRRLLLRQPRPGRRPGRAAS